MLGKQRIFIFFVGLIALEAVQYAWSQHLQIRFGDFAQPAYISRNALILAISNWLLAMCICMLTNTSRVGICVKFSFSFVILLFAGNFFLTFFGSVGHIGAAKSSVGFITTMFPINYMIFIIAADKYYKRIRPFAYIMLLLTDLTRLLFGAFLKVAVITYSKIRFSTKSMITSVLLLALIPILIEQKYKLRDLPISTETIIVQGIVSRIAMTNSFDYVLKNIDELSASCTKGSYSEALPLYGLSLIPKSIFGLSFPKSLNNCLIETYVGTEVSDSSVNAPVLASIWIHFYRGISFRSFEFLTTNLLMLVLFIALCNLVFGAYGEILKLWVVFEFFWTGNVLTLSIPIYFCILMLILSTISRGIKT